jgi:hypothetical protein
MVDLGGKDHGDKNLDGHTRRKEAVRIKQVRTVRSLIPYILYWIVDFIASARQDIHSSLCQSFKEADSGGVVVHSVEHLEGMRPSNFLRNLG